MSTHWPETLFEHFKSSDVRQVAYVPDAGHKRLIELCEADDGIHAVSLTTEEEGVALVGGAWAGGQKAVLLLQSSGVGNCINMLSLQHECRMPILMLVTMRGEWGEFNPWQVAMGKSTQDALESAGVYVYRADQPDEVAPTVQAALNFAFQTSRMVAVLIGQRVIGTKNFKK
ncbi:MULTISPECIES: thiamine pyrophosphate-binding protein [unclassified Burkholderia]|uniref:thiamine pyrophosphate-binding protein n=1 Tax=unclassified Burkholderia TaxID=2613784 RepID=UPI0014241833|nr:MULTISPECIES: thiamine pyrophosphate-binding protein [unclassified Burkholderia]NIE82705.1 phosphonopyruvate decarboxylase [Burkholderia sp. Tr-860]NIF63604.1 phosphonopyruvate decarboxylase [Burkholderia sp. Cy-647]NIF94991.1 phosphonopyruvate decarboxylase [Burkholderia sp. Ax-1720]